MQGEIWYADLEPVKGSEQSGKRPVVIVSGPSMNLWVTNYYCLPVNKYY